MHLLEFLQDVNDVFRDFLHSRERIAETANNNIMLIHIYKTVKMHISSY